MLTGTEHHDPDGRADVRPGRVRDDTDTARDPDTVRDPDTDPDAVREDGDVAAPADGPARRRPSPVGVWNGAVVLAGVVVFAVLGWQRRWISDDGLIVLRTVRNVLAGNGPVFNEGERVEVNTSTAWTVVVTLVGWVTQADLAWTAIIAGLVCSALGLGLGLDAARRLHVPDGAAPLLPLGAVALLALPPVRDFATSGLETGLVTLWIAGSWWLLVRVARGARTGALPWVAAVVLGLGPLVRPDLGLVSVLGLPLLAVLVRARWWRLVGLAAAAGALPVAYEVFRAGYYGLLVPNTALAKEASGADWERGTTYLHDTVATYWLWIPVGAALLALATLAARRTGWADRWGTVAVALFGPVAGALLALYVVRVGGDFMHGRMLLPALTAALLPVLAVPLTAWTVAPVLGVAAWAWVCAADLRVPYDARIDEKTGFVDERAFWSDVTDTEHPTSVQPFLDFSRVVNATPRAIERAPGPSLILIQPLERERFRLLPFPMRPGVDHSTMIYLNLGFTGAALPLDVRVVDGIGLANPLASHATPVFGGRVGHEKELPLPWFVADEVAIGVPTPADPVDVDLARRALTCREVADVLASVRDPLTAERFWYNLRGAVGRTTERWSRIPERAATCD